MRWFDFRVGKRASVVFAAVTAAALWLWTGRQVSVAVGLGFGVTGLVIATVWSEWVIAKAKKERVDDAAIEEESE